MQLRLWNHKMRIRFIIRKNKANSNGEAGLYCRIKINGVESNKFSTGIVIHPDKWDSKNQVIKNDSLANAHLTAIKNDLTEIYLQLKMQRKPLEPDAIRKVYKGEVDLNEVKGPEYNIRLTDLVDSFIKDAEVKKVEHRFTGEITNLDGDTVDTYRYKRNNLLLFLKYYRIEDIMAKDFDLAELERYNTYLLEQLGFSKNYRSRHLSLLRKIMDWGVGKKELLYNPLQAAKFTWARNKKVRLNREQVEALKNHCFDNTALQTTAETYIFMLETGLELKDLPAIKKEELQLIEGVEMLLHPRVKTLSIAAIPLSQMAKALLLKYDFQFPTITNQAFNRNLKKIQKELGISHLSVTSGLARKTFGMSVYNDADRRFSLESVSRMLGHSRVQTTEDYYIEVNPERVAREVKEKGF